MSEEMNEQKPEISLSEMSKEELISLVEYYKTKEIAEGAQDTQKLYEEAVKASEDYKDKWMRLAAEFDNYKKRNARIRLESLEEGKSEMAIRLLPIGDNLDRALKMQMDENTLTGLKMLKKSFDDALTSVGITEIPGAGEPFDPTVHEAVMQVPAETAELDDRVAEVYTKGYKLG
ncbi:MAG: nucleotide exchange factor GrpE, partial [Clostridia bacterium]|nr:nucleotide exchange factor GrpE [Clostridia bacterium]